MPKIKKRRSSKIRLISLLLLLIFMIGVTIKFDSRLRILINNYAASRAKIVANSVINKKVFEYLETKELTYSDLLNINTTEDGKVTSVEFDTVTITKMKAGIISNIQNEISKQENMLISVPVGTLTGYQLFNNRGPEIDISMQISSAIYSKISSNFIDAGINQTLHQITLDISADMYFVMPWYRTTGSFETDFVLAETIIVGDVPEAYTNVIEYPNSDMAGLLFDYGAEPY